MLTLMFWQNLVWFTGPSIWLSSFLRGSICFILFMGQIIPFWLCEILAWLHWGYSWCRGQHWFKTRFCKNMWWGGHRYWTGWDSARRPFCFSTMGRIGGKSAMFEKTRKRWKNCITSLFVWNEMCFGGSFLFLFTLGTENTDLPPHLSPWWKNKHVKKILPGFYFSNIYEFCQNVWWVYLCYQNWFGQLFVCRNSFGWISLIDAE